MLVCGRGQLEEWDHDKEKSFCAVLCSWLLRSESLTPLEFGKRGCEKLFHSFFRHKQTLTTTIDHAVPFFWYLPLTLILLLLRKEVPGCLALLSSICSEKASFPYNSRPQRVHKECIKKKFVPLIAQNWIFDVSCANGINGQRNGTRARTGSANQNQGQLRKSHIVSESRHGCFLRWNQILKSDRLAVGHMRAQRRGTMLIMQPDLALYTQNGQRFWNLHVDRSWPISLIAACPLHKQFKRYSTKSRISHYKCAWYGLIPFVNLFPGRMGRDAHRDGFHHAAQAVSAEQI